MKALHECAGTQSETSPEAAELHQKLIKFKTALPTT
jgi:hypothetical protein